LLLTLLLIHICFTKRISIPNDLRLIEFNETHREWKPFSFILDHVSECGKGEHGGFIDVTDHPNLKPEDQKNKKITFPVNPTHQTLVESFISKMSKDNIAAFNNMLTKRQTRYYTSQSGKDAATDILNTFVQYAEGRSDISARFFSHTWLQPSVIARIEGEGPNKDEVVIIGAHEDSITSRADAPGADDDASGVSVLLETYRVLAQNGFKPSRSIEFHTYSAEEVGLRGSMDIANNYQKNGVNVVSMMQLDMTMYPGSSGKIGVVGDYVDSSLTSFLRKLVSTYADVNYVDTKCGYGCSDHASWYKAGFSACFPFESEFSTSNPKIHTIQDLLANLSVDHGAEFVKVALGFAVELSLDTSK